MAEENPTINVEEMMKKLNSQIENIVNERVAKVVMQELKPTYADIQKLAELGKQQSEQLANLVTNVNDLGKKMAEPPKRISKTDIEETGKGFETLLED